MASEYYVTRNDELCHYGIKGQRWGVRRFENYDGTLTPEGMERYYGKVGKDADVSYKEIKEYRSNTINRLKKTDKRLNKIKKLQDKAYALAKKYDFDHDDGGGGSTKESQKAGEKYMEYWDHIEYLEQEIAKDAVKKGRELTIENFGEKRVSDLEKRDKLKGFAIFAGLESAILLPIILMAINDLSHNKS